MEKAKQFVLWFDQLHIEDVPLVGGKNASLGEMYQTLTPKGVKIPNGFAVTAYAYRYFLDHAGLHDQIQAQLDTIDYSNVRSLQKAGKKIRQLITRAKLPEDLVKAVSEAYGHLEKQYDKHVDVAVRSSATAEDLPGASFAGQQETYLNVVGPKSVVEKTKHCFASLFTDRAISYRHDQGFDHMDAALSVAVQKMVRSDLSSSGVMFSLDTETGFPGVVVIDAVYGLGELIVQGKVTPDEYVVFKGSRRHGYQGVIGKTLGAKDRKMIYTKKGGGKIVPVPVAEQNTFALSDGEIGTLADWAIIIEDHFSAKHGHYQAMDMEWAKDGQSGELYITQARPETVVSQQDVNVMQTFSLTSPGEKACSGIAVGTKIATGVVKILNSSAQMHTFKPGEILVTDITDPDWEPIMKTAAAIITNKGGRTSHAAIVSRELGIPCIVGTENATSQLKNGQMITVDCSSGNEGIIYDGQLEFEVDEERLDTIPDIRTKIMTNVGAPDEAFKYHRLPVKGVGLGRLEFIIASHIQVHPKALLNYEELKTDPKQKDLVSKIDQLTAGYEDKSQYYVDKLAQGIAKIAAAFHPHDVIIRFSDFKTNEYRTLLGGNLFEPEEANPMIGWRGASRYYDSEFKDAFRLECQAIAQVRDQMGLRNVVPMVPFCRTVDEGHKVLGAMAEFGLHRGEGSDLRVFMMCEVPSNVVRAADFLELFDGYSIGSNDLAQLTLGLDRDSSLVNHVGNELHPAVKDMVTMAVKAAQERGKYIGLCGQAPSDFPDFAKFLVEIGISSMSVTPDTVIRTIKLVAEQESID